MREIKFEYGFESVKGIVKKTYYLHEIPNIKDKCDVWNELPIVYVRQFTGLHDKNGKEIYEGDIVLHDYEKIVVSYGIQGVDAFEGIGFNLWSHYWKKQDGTRLQSEIEVIGNIYENKELLNK